MKNMKSNLIAVMMGLVALAVVSGCDKKHDDAVQTGQYAYIAQFPQECQAPVNSGAPTYNPPHNDEDRDEDRDDDRDYGRGRNRHRHPYHPDQEDQQPAYQQSSVQYASVHFSFTVYQNSGCVPYNWNRAGRFHRGGCPRGTFAACAPGAGMVCMPGNTYNNNEIAWYAYRQGSRSAGLCGFESRQTRGACSYNSHDDGSGYIGRGCIVNQPETCGTGRCAPISDRSAVGVCVR